jgi:hypothetical protein
MKKLTKEQLAPFVAWGSQGGKTKTPKKAKASRENGKLGGRPKKTSNDSSL